jgi:hypothetical protein
MTTTTVPNFAERALLAYENAERERMDRERDEHATADRDVRALLAKRFQDHFDKPGVTVTPLAPDAPGADPGWFKYTPTPWELPYRATIEGVTFVVFAASNSLFVVNHCGICKRPWTVRCDYELRGVGEALATLHDCEEPGATPPTPTQAPSSDLSRPMGAVLGGPDSDNLAIVAHNLGVIATLLDRFFDCGAAMAGRGV